MNHLTNHVTTYHVTDADRKIQGITIKDKATVTNAVSVDELSKVVKTIKLEAPSTPVMHRTGSTQSLDG